MTLRDRILNHVRALALKAVFEKDMETWDRCADILDRNAKRKLDSYTAQREELADAR